MGKGRQIMIIGASEGLGLEFSQLAAADAGELFLVGSQEDQLIATESQLKSLGARSTRMIVGPLKEPHQGERIYEEWMMHNFLGETSTPLDTLINVTAFGDWEGDPWEMESPDPSLHMENLLTLNMLFAREMVKQRHGRILNVLYHPPIYDPYLQSMFHATRETLLEYAVTLSQQLAHTEVYVNTLVASEQSFMLQAERLPTNVAPDMAPPTCSARDLAGYGYQVLRAS